MYTQNSGNAWHTPHTSMTVIVIPEDINAVRRKQLYRSVRCNIYAQQELQVGRNFGQMFSMGKQLLICADLGHTGRNFGHTGKKAEDSDEGEDPSETASMLPAMCSNQKTKSRYAFLLPAVGG